MIRIRLTGRGQMAAADSWANREGHVACGDIGVEEVLSEPSLLLPFFGAPCHSHPFQCFLCPFLPSVGNSISLKLWLFSLMCVILFGFSVAIDPCLLSVKDVGFSKGNGVSLPMT